jgi:phosphoribosylamine--glycine ligase
MGAYAPTSIATPELIAQVMSEIMRPTLAAMKEAGAPFTGLLYAGIMITDEGPKVVEFNCRFGDPETQTLMPLMDSSLLELVAAVAGGGSLSRAKIPDWKPLSSVTTVVAAAGYPHTVRTGDVIELPPHEEGVEVFHAGTARDPSTNELVTAGGRVLAVTAVAPSLAEAAEMSRSHAERVSFKGKQLRRDIGWREAARGAGAT